MKPLVERDLDEKTVQQAIETIRDRVDSLGVSEPLIQEYGLGANQILVELPGVTNLDQIKSMIQSTARLEIHAVVGDPNGYADEQAALASVTGTLPPDEMLARGSHAGHRPNRPGLRSSTRGHRGGQRFSIRRTGYQFQYWTAGSEFHPD